MENMIINTIKEQVEHRIRELVSYENSHDNGYKYFWKSKEWNNYDKSSLYITLVDNGLIENNSGLNNQSVLYSLTDKYIYDIIMNNCVENQKITYDKYHYFELEFTYDSIKIVGNIDIDVMKKTIEDFDIILSNAENDGQKEELRKHRDNIQKRIDIIEDDRFSVFNTMCDNEIAEEATRICKKAQISLDRIHEIKK